MSSCNFTRQVKIVLSGSVCCTTVGIILIVVGIFLTQRARNDIAWEAQDVAKATLTVPGGGDGENHCGFLVLTRGEEAARGEEFRRSCPMFNASLTLTPPAPGPFIKPLCDNQKQYELNREILVQVAYINVTNAAGRNVVGRYVLSSTSVNFWVLDYCNPFSRSSSVLASAFGLIIASLVVFSISCILCCVSCCLCARSPPAELPDQAGMRVIGRPVLGTGMLVTGQPVGTVVVGHVVQQP